MKSVKHTVLGRPVILNRGKKSNGTDWTVTFQNGKSVPLSDVLALIKPFPKGIKESKMNESYYTAIANLGNKKIKENLDSFDELQKFMSKMRKRNAISVQVTKISGSKKQTINYDWDGKNWVNKNKTGIQEALNVSRNKLVKLHKELGDKGFVKKILTIRDENILDYLVDELGI